MATSRTYDDLIALYPDNVIRQITAQNLRDLVASTFSGFAQVRRSTLASAVNVGLFFSPLDFFEHTDVSQGASVVGSALQPSVNGIYRVEANISYTTDIDVDIGFSFLDGAAPFGAMALVTAIADDGVRRHIHLSAVQTLTTSSLVTCQAATFSGTTQIALHTGSLSIQRLR